MPDRAPLDEHNQRAGHHPRQLVVPALAAVLLWCGLYFLAPYITPARENRCAEYCAAAQHDTTLRRISPPPGKNPDGTPSSTALNHTGEPVRTYRPPDA